MQTSEKAAWLAEHLLYWPDDLTRSDEKYLMSGNGMLEIIEAMRGRGYDCDIVRHQETECRFTNTFRGVGKWTKADTLPIAVIHAAWEALNHE